MSVKSIKSTFSVRLEYLLEYFERTVGYSQQLLSWKKPENSANVIEFCTREGSPHPTPGAPYRASNSRKRPDPSSLHVADSHRLWMGHSFRVASKPAEGSASRQNQIRTGMQLFFYARLQLRWFGVPVLQYTLRWSKTPAEYPEVYRGPVARKPSQLQSRLKKILLTGLFPWLQNFTNYRFPSFLIANSHSENITCSPLKACGWWPRSRSSTKMFFDGLCFFEWTWPFWTPLKAFSEEALWFKQRKTRRKVAPFWRHWAPLVRPAQRTG